MPGIKFDRGYKASQAPISFEYASMCPASREEVKQKDGRVSTIERFYLYTWRQFLLPNKQTRDGKTNKNLQRLESKAPSDKA